MDFKEIYISTKENSAIPDIKKIILSDDAYAIGDMISELIKKLEHLRLSLI